MSDEPQIKVVKVPNYLRIHPRTLELYEQMLAALTPEAKAEFEERERIFERKILGG
jgi:hypothetical protein